MGYFNVVSFVLSQQLAAREGITDPQRQNFFGLLGGVMGSTPVGLGVTLALANQEAQQTVSDVAPAVSAISPSSGAVGSSVPVTITGTNFRNGARVATDNADVTVTNVVVVNDKEITATLVIAGSASAGSAGVSVTTAGGTSAPVQFAITLEPPVITSISPSSGAPGSSVPVTITGTNLNQGALQTDNANVTVSNVVVASDTQITATLVIAAATAPGIVSVFVSTGTGGPSGAIVFTITSGAPTITSITPSVTGVGHSVPVLITGSNFSAGATVSVGATPPVTVSNVNVVSSTQILATFTISNITGVSTATVTVTTSQGTSTPVVLTMAAAPTATGVSPAHGAQASSVTITVTGTNFVPGAVVQFADTAITTSNVTVASQTSITATCNIGDSATVGSTTLKVTTPGGSSADVAFTVDPKGSAIPSKTDATTRTKERGGS
jgi:hypothetical protein